MDVKRDVDESPASKASLKNLSAAEYSRLSTLWDQLIEIAHGDREAWLAAIEGGEPRVAALLRALCAAQADSRKPGFLETNDLIVHQVATLVEADPGLIGRQFGPYRVLGLLGHGGMGSVWLAERVDGLFTRKVALKLIHVALKSRVAGERFAREREILASLDHPNIARLIDAGFAEDGQPYLALEYVAGAPLTTYCDAHRLSVDERLMLFCQILNAVQYAHMHLVIHRDLKPANILVTEEGRVQLLDFGIAKLLSAGTAARETELTQLGGRALTPDYAAPEQIVGAPVTTAADVYALGVILYELLTGERPYKLKRDSRGALEEAILQSDSVPPSRIALSEASAGVRATSAGRLARALRGDLDAIVAKAMRKEPERRYESVAALRADIERSRRHEPVFAREGARAYAVGRFLRRHRTFAAVGVMLTAAILVGTAATLWQARVAARERDRALALSSRNLAVIGFLDTLITQAAQADRPITVSDMLARSETLANSEFQGNPENRAAVLAMLGAHYHTTGEDQRAEPLLRAAVDAARDSKDPDLRATVACQQALTLAALGQVQQASRTLSAAASDPKISNEVAAECLEDLSFMAQDDGDAANTLKYGKLALERLRSASHPPLVTEAGYLASIAYAQSLNGHNDEAESTYASSMDELVRAGCDRCPTAVSVRNNWAIVSIVSGNPRRALQLLDQTLEILGSNDPQSLAPSYLLANRARALELLGRLGDARGAYVQCAAQAQKVSGVNSQAFCLLGLVGVWQALGNLAEAKAALDQASRIIPDSVPATAPPRLALEFRRGQLALAESRLTEARARLDAVVAGTRAPQTLIYPLLARAALNLADHRLGAAESDARRALSSSRQTQGRSRYSCHTGVAWLTLARVLAASGASGAARKAAQAAIDQLADTVDADHPSLLAARSFIAAPDGP